MKIFQSVKNFFFKPSTKLGLGVLLVLGAIGGVVAKVGFDETLHRTSTEEFCVSCHSMEGVQAELKETAHWKNEHGVAAQCADCHLPHDTIPKYMRKIQALKEVYAEATGKYDEEGSFEKHRYEMAKREWDRMSANGSAECKACHSYERMDFDKMSQEARDRMMPAAEKNQSCIDCHKGIAHHMPKAPEGGIDPNLVASSVSAGKTYYTAAKTPLFADEALTQEIGYLENTVPVQVLDSKPNAQLVELAMWHKVKGYGRIWYHDFAKSITDAVLTKEFMQSEPQLEKGESREDELTGIMWQQVKMTAWVPAGRLSDNLEPLWAKAENLYNTACSVCHKQPDVKHFDSNTWVGVFNGMKGFTSLTETEAKQVLRYLQMHASDAKESK